MSKERSRKLNILFRPLFFAFSAFVALISITVAWFAANSKVDSGGMQVNISRFRFELASEGTEGLYYVPGGKGETVEIDGKTLYKTTTEKPTITWMVGAESNVNNETGNHNGKLCPGASGKITFYILPKEWNEDDFTVKVSINKLIYQRADGETDIRIQDMYGNVSAQDIYLQELTASDKKVAQELLEGHLLFFGEYSEPYYSDWIQDGTMEIKVTGTEPVPVTIYWVWPYVFEQLIEVEGTRHEPLCDSSVINGDYDKLKQDLANNPSHYLRKLSAETDEENVVDIENVNEKVELYRVKYNRGDEFIGTRINYMFLELQAE